MRATGVSKHFVSSSVLRLRCCKVAQIFAYRFLVETRPYEVLLPVLRRRLRNTGARAFEKCETIVAKVLKSLRVQIKVTAIVKETRWNLSGNSGKSKKGSSCEGAIGLFETDRVSTSCERHTLPPGCCTCIYSENNSNFLWSRVPRHCRKTFLTAPRRTRQFNLPLQDTNHFNGVF